tara:strand:+ start:3914 stop:4252 length:339 start_codon:yes stop_codon:yes gene_type:complete
LYDLQATHIKAVSEATLGDLSPEQAFSEFIGSLGLLGRYAGEAKLAFTELQRQVRMRGWLPGPWSRAGSVPPHIGGGSLAMRRTGAELLAHDAAGLVLPRRSTHAQGGTAGT